MKNLGRLVLTVVVMGVVAFFAFADKGAKDAPEVAVSAGEAALAAAADYLTAEAGRQMSLSGRENFVPRSVNEDGSGFAHVRYDSHVNGVRVFGGEVIVHVDQKQGKAVGLSSFHPTVKAAESIPVVQAGEASRIALWNLDLPFLTKDLPPAELVFYPSGKDFQLAWLVDAFIEDDSLPGPVARMFVIDAFTGDILTSWDNLHTGKPSGGGTNPGSGTTATGSGRSLYLGTVPMNTEYYTSGTYGMVDKHAGNSYTINMNNGTKSGTLFTDTDNVWGSGSTSDKASAGVDAHLGMTYTYDYFKNVHGRNGLWNNGTGVYSRVHYSRSYNNAFWSDACKCMTYGDGDGYYFSPLTCLDVAAHEMSHGLCAATAKLAYSGESGGLNESNSDIFGCCVEFYANNPSDRPDWLIGETIYLRGTALRYMDHPTKDGYSIDHYSDYYSGLDVHYSSGLANNFFYLLANGGTNDTSKLSVSGIGIAKAERIWYVALTGYMSSTCTFAGARAACVNAATQLYGASSTEVQRVKDAWYACGVN